MNAAESGNIGDAITAGTSVTGEVTSGAMGDDSVGKLITDVGESAGNTT